MAAICAPSTYAADRVGLRRPVEWWWLEETVLDTSAWQRLTLRVQDQLLLDPKNVRLETTSAQVEADIIEDLFDNENAFDLVDAIAKIGYLTHEVPIVVKRKGKYIVVEGNRRLSALKAIQNPKIVPSYESRVAACAKAMGKVRDSLASIEVLVAPNQTQADQLIAALHTSNPRKPWSPARQAAFFQAQIDAGRKYKQLLDRYPTVDVPDFVLRARLVNRLKQAVAGEPDLADFIGSKEWKTGFSALTRIFESKDFRDVTGIGLDADGTLQTSLDDSAFDAVARLIVQGMQERSINTRTLNKVTSPRFIQLMTEIRAAIGQSPTAGTGGGGTPTAGGAAAPGGATGNSSTGAGGASGGPAGGTGGTGGATGKTGQAGPGATKPTPTAKAKAKTTALPIGSVTVPDAFGEPLKAHFAELSVINIQRTPNAAFLMLRAILEKSIKAYADAKGVEIAKTKHQNNGRVQLHNCLTWVVEYWGTHKKDLVDPARRVQGGRLAEFTQTKDALNAANHNYKFSVDSTEVERAWESIDPILRELLAP